MLFLVRQPSRASVRPPRRHDRSRDWSGRAESPGDV